MSKFSAIILAAGKGTRMQSKLPKVMHKIAGRSMISYVVDAVSCLEPAKTVTVISPDPKMEDVKTAVMGVNKKAQFAVQEKQLGTGDAVKSALPKLGKAKNHILVLYGDTPFISPETIANMMEMLESELEPAVVVLGFVPFEPGEYGRLVVSGSGELEAIVEYKDANIQEQQIELCNSGVMAIHKDVAEELLGKITNKNAKKEYYLTDIVEIARKLDYPCATVETVEEEVLGINSREQLAMAEMMVQDRLRMCALDMGVTLIAPDTIYFSYDTMPGQDVVIHPHVVIAPGVEIGDEVEIKSFTHLEGCKVNKGATVGPFARVRRGSDIGKDSKIGNFVEVKNSKIGQGSSISHLSYIGDTEMGREVNIGAGTITCNYDGKKKHMTKIGDRAFIGSNTSLVAPVRVGKSATIGAGSTIWKDVKPKKKVVNEMPIKEI